MKNRYLRLITNNQPDNICIKIEYLYPKLRFFCFGAQLPDQIFHTFNRNSQFLTQGFFDHKRQSVELASRDLLPHTVIKRIYESSHYFLRMFLVLIRHQPAPVFYFKAGLMIADSRVIQPPTLEQDKSDK